MSTFSKYFLMIVALGIFTACRGTHEQQAADASRYTEAAAMSFHRTEPERALVMIDSAVIAGNVSPQRGAFLRATTQYGGLHNLPLARQTCLEMLENKFAPADSLTAQQTWLLLAGIEYTSGNHPAIIRYATEASRLAHALGRMDDRAKAEGLIAQSMAQTGRTEEGIGHLREVLADLRKMETFRSVTAYHEVSKKLIRILLDNRRYDEIVDACHASLERIGELESNPQCFADMNAGFNPSEFVDFARGQTQAYLTIAYALKGDLPKAREAEAAVFKTRWSQSVDCDKLMSAAYHHMGEFDRFEQAMRRFEYSYPDTVNANFLICLEQRSEASALQGRKGESLDYLRRAYVIRDSLDRRNQRGQLNELATLYRLQDEQLARQQAEADARFFRLLTWAAVIALAAAIAFALYFFYKRREIARKNHALACQIAETAEYQEQVINAASHAPAIEPGVKLSSLSDAELFQHLRDAILRDRLYLDPQLDRQKLVDGFGLSKERIGAAFARGSHFKSLPDFLTDCRLPYAAKLLAERPELPVSDVAYQSGFANAETFSRSFRQQYTLTPTQFRAQQALNR